mgnify:CR=1 FL=1
MGSSIPEYLSFITRATCVGFGHCFKICSREIMYPYGIDGAGEILGRCDCEADDFDGEPIE